MKNCSEIREQINLYIDDELSSTERKEFEEHIESCEACSTELAEIMQVVSLCTSVSEEELPETFKEQLHRKLIDVAKNETEDKKVVFLRNRYVKIISSLAAIFLMVVIARGIFNSTLAPGKFEVKNSQSEMYAADMEKITAADSPEVKENNSANSAPKAKQDDAGIRAMDQAQERADNDVSTMTDRGTRVLSFGIAAASIPTELKSIEIVVTADNQEMQIEQIKNHALQLGGEPLADAAGSVLIDAGAKSLNAAEANDVKEVSFRIPNEEYESFIEALKSDPGLSSLLQFGSMNVISIENIIAEKNIMIEDLDKKIGEIEKDGNSETSTKLEQLKCELNTIKLDIAKTKDDARYTLVSFKIRKD